MLGEGLTTGAPVQQMKYDEAAFDRSGRSRRPRARWLLVLAASVIVAVAIAL